MNAQKDLVLSFAGIHEEEMEEAVQTIVSIWKQVDKRI